MAQALNTGTTGDFLVDNATPTPNILTDELTVVVTPPVVVAVFPLFLSMRLRLFNPG
jgi:hypothetical protein